jgi:polyhydroxyalkanoate synthesis regulator phasin
VKELQEQQDTESRVSILKVELEVSQENCAKYKGRLDDAMHQKRLAEDEVVALKKEIELLEEEVDSLRNQSFDSVEDAAVADAKIVSLALLFTTDIS